MFSRFSRYSNPQSEWATEQYAQLAEQHGLSLTQLALAFIKQQFFVTSTIIGATNLDQLKENIQAFEIDLSEEILKGIEAYSPSATESGTLTWCCYLKCTLQVRVFLFYEKLQI